MPKIFKLIKCRFIGYFKRLTTGKCGLHLYYTGCGCDECNKYYEEEFNKFIENAGS
jgi:hypothetical protein